MLFQIIRNDITKSESRCDCQHSKPEALRGQRHEQCHLCRGGTRTTPCCPEEDRRDQAWRCCLCGGFRAGCQIRHPYGRAGLDRWRTWRTGGFARLLCAFFEPGRGASLREHRLSADRLRRLRFSEGRGAADCTKRSAGFS